MSDTYKLMSDSALHLLRLVCWYVTLPMFCQMGEFGAMVTICQTYWNVLGVDSDVDGVGYVTGTYVRLGKVSMSVTHL